MNYVSSAGIRHLCERVCERIGRALRHLAPLAGNNFNSSCAHLIRATTSLPLRSQGVVGRDEPGQDEIGEANSLPWPPLDFSPDSPALLRGGRVPNCNF